MYHLKSSHAPLWKLPTYPKSPLKAGMMTHARPTPHPWAWGSTFLFYRTWHIKQSNVQRVTVCLARKALVCFILLLCPRCPQLGLAPG